LHRVWTVRVGQRRREVSTPLVSGGAAFVSDGDQLTAVELATGATRWQTTHTLDPYGAVYLGQPALVQGAISTPWLQLRSVGTVASDPATGAYDQSQGSWYRFGHLVRHRRDSASVQGSLGPGYWQMGLLYAAPHPGYLGTTGNPGAFTDPVFVGSLHIWVGELRQVARFDPGGVCVAPPEGYPICEANAVAPLDGDVVGLAAGADHTLIATTANGLVEVLDGVDGHELWRAVPGAALSPPAVAGGVIVVGDSNGIVHAYSATGCAAPTCAPIWEGAAGSAVATAPAFSNGTVYVATADGSVVAFAASGCGAATCAATAVGLSKRASPVTGGPVVADGFVVIGTANGKLTAFRTA
jgi:outer membrane protein assembly factor BamB